MRKRIFIGLMIVLFVCVPNFIQGAIPALERAALIALYNSTNGDGWTDSSGWKTPPLDIDGFAMPGTESGWYGIVVDADQVITISLGGNQLIGSIPSELGNLSNLQTLEIYENQLSGSIPAEIGNLSNLHWLGLHNNQLNGSIPPGLGNLSNLTNLNLDNNQLSGGIPSQLGNLSNLQELWLPGNQLSGSIPPQLGNLNNLKYIGLSMNQMCGNIPPELGNLSNLMGLNLNDNQLSGGIPSELGNLSNLQYLWLHNNQLSGSIPSQLGNLSNLLNLNMFGNHLSGDIPSNFTSLTNISQLDVGYNCLSATDPTLRTWLDTHDPDWESNQTNCGTITVTSPNGGETWLIGSTHDITWTSSGTVGNVKIEYSGDSGVNWTEITASTENDGIYSWTAPGISSTNCLVRISETGGNPSDISDGVFTIVEGITGRVMDESENGIANVQVQAYTFASTSYAGAAATDADGNYAIGGITPGNYKVLFSPPNGSNYVYQWYNNKNSSEIADPVTITAGQTTNGINAQLVLGGAVSGRVTDEADAGILNVNVGVYLNNISYWNSTDADGYYTVRGIPAGNCTASFYTANAGNYIQEWYNDKSSQETADIFSVTPGQTTGNIDAQLAAGSIISGRVTDVSGSGIPNVQASAQEVADNSWYAGTSDADGYYEIVGLRPGNYKVDFYTQNAGNYIEEWYNDKVSFENADTILLSAKQTIGNIDAQLNTGSIISGRVTDISGSGIPNVRASAQDVVDRWGNSGTSDANGYYAITGLKPGSYKVEFHTQNAGNYLEEWYNDKASFENADTILLSANQTIDNIDAQLAEGGIVSGRVMDESGNGIKDIEVDIFNLSHSNVAASVTDSEGNYSVGGIPGGNYKIFFSGYHQNYVPEYYNDKTTFDTADQVTVTVGQTTPGIDAQLALGGMISGRITDANGNGIANVGANVHNQNNEILYQHGYADSLGYYRIYGIPAGTYKVHFTCYDLNYISEWYNDKNSYETADPVIVTVGQTTPGIDAQLTEGGIISGAITGTGGAPLENTRVEARISAFVVSGSAYTDSSGQYTLQGLPSGAYKIYFSNYSQNYFPIWYNNKTTYETADPLNVTVGQTIPNIDAQLAQGGTISGTITDGSGNPIDLVGVSIYDMNNQSTAGAGTNSSGYYLTTTLPAGNYKIRFTPTYGSVYLSEWYNDKTTFSDADAIPVTAGQTAIVDAQLPTGGSVTGTVTDISGNPIQNVNVCVYITSGSYKSALTNPEGKYEVVGMATGNYKVYFNAASTGYCSEWYIDKSTYAAADPVGVTAEQTTPGIDAQLILGGTLTGRVADESGNGIQNVRVRLYDSGNKTVSIVATNSSGNYTLVGILPGSYRVYFDATYVAGNYVSEYYNDKFILSRADAINITSGQTTTIDAVLSPGGIMSGRVTDTGGNGIANVHVSVRNAYSNGQYKYKYTDGSGNYTIQGIPASLCKVYFNTDSTTASYVPEWYNDKTDSYYAQIFTVTPGQTFSGINAVLASGGIISGRITDASTGAGIAEMEVYVYDLSGYNVDSYGYSDGNGDYTIKGLATGNYKINFDTYYYNLSLGANYIDQWYNDKNSLPTADSVVATAGQTTSGINAALTAGGGTISGRVTDENGVGIANTTVYVEKDWTDADYWDGQTDADGNYQVSGITEGAYHVYFYPPITPVSYAPQIYNGKVFKNSPEEEGDWVQVANGGTTPNIDAVLSPAGTVTGRVTDESGNGIPSIRVRLYDANGDSFAFINAATDYYGYYTITRVPPGQMKAYFSSSDVLGGKYRCVFYNNKQGLTAADTFTVQAGITTADIDAVMTEGGGGTISGYVRLKSGQALNGAVIKLYDMAGPYSLLSQLSTNSSGYFEFKGLLPGTYKLSASCKSIYAAEWYNEKDTHAAANAITVTEGGAAQVEITLGETDSLQVTSPNGGEVWDTGSLQTITWTNAGPVGNIKIEYSINNGLNWIEIVSSMENTGNYNWTVPAAPSPNCKIRISGPGGVPSDISDAVFTIFSNPAGWVPVIGMQNNMAVYGKAYHGITAAAAGDWLGAFGPGGVADCRGVAIVGVDGNYYITIRSNASSAETITFKLWPNPSGPVIDASETIEFISDNIYADLPLHFGPRTQNIPMMLGWNWSAFNVLPADTSLNSVFAAVLGSVEQVKSQTQAAIYSSGNWIGDLTDMSGIANGIMYKVKTTQTGTLSANGLTISFNKPLPLVLGWNWTAYLPMPAQPVETALNSIMAPLNQVKSQTQSAVKIGNGLIGDLTQMEPNKGYTIKTTAPGVLIYPYGAAVSADGPGGSGGSGGTLAEITPDVSEVPWKVIKGNQYNMVAFGKVYLEGQAVDTSGYYLASVGPNGEGDCRSVSPIGTDGYYFSTILGNTNGETIKFKLYDSINHKTYDIVGSTTFQSDDLRADYNLVACSIKVTAPGGGESPVMGSIFDIAWDAYNVTNVKIELYKNGKSLSIIVDSVPAATTTYSWTIPARMRAGNNYQIKISAVDAGVMAKDISNAFSIAPLAAITLNYPVAADVWQVKRSYDITWGSSGINDIKIELYKGAALNTVISESTPAAAGKFTWTVPANQAPGSDYKIKISSVDAGINLSDIGKSPFSIAAYKNTPADFDGDGKADIIWRYYGAGGYNCLWTTGLAQESPAINDPRLAPQAALIQDETDTDNKIVGSGDFNNDGKEDILWRNKTDGANFIWTMNGTTYAGTAQLPAETDLSWDICGTGDFNSDGKPDILWRNRTAGGNKVWLMDGIARTGEVLLTSEATQAWDIGGAGDFDSDGKPDILWRNTADGSNRIWIMNGTTLVRTESLSTVYADWETVGVGDYDGNGKPDIFWRNKVDGRNSVWLMEGLSRQKAETLTQATDATWKIEN
ncbi:MAG: carboxypeptidase regulatory-like domain-containing protein [Candidatus Aminicenantes bacterium]|nr:carboxypeptidase regulatory-like domain-containing protein [Candidatus Aminicenantes bacterium]